MATTYETFLPEVMPHCSGAPEDQVVNAIRNATIEWCGRSWCWIKDTDVVGLTANEPRVTLVSPVTGADITEILYGTYSGKRVDASTRDDEERLDPNWRNRTGTRPLRFIGEDELATVILIPVPSTTVAVGSANPIVQDGLFFTCALSPQRTSTDVPDWIYEHYVEDIAKGALARMYAMPKKLWTNANLAATHKRAFEDAAASVRVDASKSFTRAPLRNYRTGVARW